MRLGQVIIVVVTILVGLLVLLPIVGWTIGLGLTLVVAGLIGWFADQIVPGDLPYGKAGAVGAGVGGAVLGSLIPGINGLGPEFFSIRVMPAFVGAMIVVALVEYFGSRPQPAGQDQ